MNKLMLSLFFLSSFAHGQDNAGMYQTCPYDSTKKDWSCLDRMYLISQIIDPNSVIYPRPDTLLFNFPLPLGETNKRRIERKRNINIYALLIGGFKKDSMSYKIIGMELAWFPWDCYKAYYPSHKLKYEKMSFEKKLSYLTTSFYLPTEALFSTNYDKSRTIVLHHNIDTTNALHEPSYVRIFNKYVDWVIGDILYQSDPVEKARYKQVFHIFYSNGKIVGKSTYNLRVPDFPKMYHYSFWESFEKNYGGKTVPLQLKL